MKLVPIIYQYQHDPAFQNLENRRTEVSIIHVNIYNEKIITVSREIAVSCRSHSG
jgi:hypothetical protein